MSTESDIAASQQNTSIPLVARAFSEGANAATEREPALNGNYIFNNQRAGTDSRLIFDTGLNETNRSSRPTLSDEADLQKQKKQDRFSYMISRMTDTGFAMSKEDVRNMTRKDLDDGLTEEEQAKTEDVKDQLAEEGNPEVIQEHNENADQVVAESGGTLATVTDENGIKGVVAGKEGMEDEAEVVDAKIVNNTVAEQTGDTELIQETEADLETLGEEAKQEAIKDGLEVDADTPTSPTTSVASDMAADQSAISSMSDFSAASAPVADPTSAPKIEQPIVAPVTQEVVGPAL